MNITSEINGYWVDILFDGIVHCSYKQASLIGLQTWIEARNCYDIYVYTKEKTIHLTYSSREVWSLVIKEIIKSR